jgi:hypothetical protein
MGRDEESSETFTTLVPGHGVSFSTQRGEEYTHLARFDATPDGLIRAQRLARRVQTALNDKGVAGLDLAHWGTRIIYGSQAYQEDEPEIVQREKEDALLNEGYSF